MVIHFLLSELKSTIRTNLYNSFLKPKRDVFWKQISIARRFVTLSCKELFFTTSVINLKTKGG